MHEIDMQVMSPAFHECWQSACAHIERQAQGGKVNWLRAHPLPPFLEHLSFRLGNQLFFVRVADAQGRVTGPGSRAGLYRVADACQGHACVLTLERDLAGTWHPVDPGWGLRDARSGALLDPAALVSDEPIPMTDWEMHDFAVQVVRESLEREGHQLISWQGDPAVDPSIWFVGRSGQPEWVVVRAARFPRPQPARPSNWRAIAASVAHRGRAGHFAPVVVMGLDWLEEEDDGLAVDLDGDEEDMPLSSPLWRGHALDVDYGGLEPGELH